jgi:hypothetical protein
MHDDTNRGGGPSDAGEGVDVAPLEAGTEVCVWNHFFDDWTAGFAVARVEDGGYRLARLSDGHVFDDVFAFDSVIPERRRAQAPGLVGTDRDRRQEQAPRAAVGYGTRREPFVR